jgi:uncharacterized protein (TIGR00255 family)
MINSMTGYGRAQGKGAKGVSVTVDIKSVNNRYLTVCCRMPDVLAHRMQAVEDIVKKQVARGSVNYFLKLSLASRSESFSVDTALLRKYLDVIGSMQSKMGVKKEPSVEAAMSLPGVITGGENNNDVSGTVWPLVVKTTHAALRRLKEMRRNEGRNIAADLRNKVKTMGALLVKIARTAPGVRKGYQKRMLERSRQLLAGTGIAVDENDMMRELAFYAERSSIEEEIIRIKSHLKQVGAVLKASGPAGRQLEFLSQELLREANTMASKAADAGLSQVILKLKNEVDKFREQVFNVE